MSIKSVYYSYCVYWSWPRRLHRLQVASALLSGFLLNLMAGSFYTYGNVQPYIVSYIRQRSHPSDLRFNQSAYVFSCQAVFFTIGVLVGSLIEKSIGPRISTILAGIGIGLGIILTIISIKYSFWLLMVTYGIINGFNIGFLYSVAVVFVLKWVPNWAGLASGFSTSAVGLGTMIFNAFQSSFINPSNEYPNDAPYPNKPDETYFSQEDLLDRLLDSFLIQGLLVIVVTLLVSIFMVYPKPDQGTTEQSSRSQKDKVSVGKAGLHPCDLLVRANFYIVWLNFAIASLTVGIVFPLYKTYGLEVVGSSDQFLSITGIVSGVGSLMGRFVFGLLADKVDHKIAFVVNSSLMAVLLFTLYTTSLRWSAMYMIWVSGINFSYGGFNLLLGVAALRDFGEKHLNANFAMLFSSYIPGAIIAGFIADYCIDLLDWYGTFLLLGGLTCIHLIASLFMVNKKFDKVYTKHFLYSVINLEI